MQAVELKIYPPFRGQNTEMGAKVGYAGHQLFFEVREPWFSDAVRYFSSKLSKEVCISLDVQLH